MFRRKQQPQPIVATSHNGALLPVLTQAEVLTTVDLLEAYMDLVTDQKTIDLASTLIVRLLDRIQLVETPAVTAAGDE